MMLHSLRRLLTLYHINALKYFKQENSIALLLCHDNRQKKISSAYYKSFLIMSHYTTNENVPTYDTITSLKGGDQYQENRLKDG